MAESLIAYVTRTHGPLRGARLLTFMIAWDITAQALGHPPTAQEHADWWKESRRTAQRDLARFREAFPTEKDPTRLMAVARRSWDESRGVPGLGALKLDRLGVAL